MASGCSRRKYRTMLRYLLAGVILGAATIAILNLGTVLIDSQLTHPEVHPLSPPIVEYDRRHTDDPTQRMVIDPPSSHADVISARVEHMRRACEGKQASLYGPTPTQTVFRDIIIDTDRKYLYCPVFKVGSTFYQRALYALRTSGDVKNPYDVPIDTALKAPVPRLAMLGTGVSSVSFLFDVMRTFPSDSNTESFLVVREPFVRLFSGYMDKLFSPNYYYWKMLGKPIISKLRPGASADDLACGHTVTFREFIKYVIEMETAARDGVIFSARNNHFTPAYDQCKVCALNYTLLSKMETFGADAEVILKHLGVEITPDTSANWSKLAVEDAIADSVNSPFSWKENVLPCITWFDSLKKVWWKLKTRGIIPILEKFPFTKTEAEKSVTAEDLIKSAIEINAKADRSLLKRQKKEVLAMAYSTVDRRDILKVIDLYRPDFEIFQYDQHPDFIFEEEFVSSVTDKSWMYDWKEM